MFIRHTGVVTVLVAFLIYTKVNHYLIIGTSIAVMLMLFSYEKYPLGFLIGIVLLLIFMGFY